LERKRLADKITMRILLPFVFALLCSAAEPAPPELPRHVLTNDGLIVLARAGVGDALLVDLVRYKRTHFDTSAEALAALARHGLAESVIRAVVEKQEQVQLRPPQVTMEPVAPREDGRIEIAPGSMLMLPSEKNKRPRGDAGRWYKISMR